MSAPEATPSPGQRAAQRAGEEALRAGAWSAALARFEEALAEGERAEALEGLARAAWWLGDAERVLAARERAYRLYRQRRDARGAARLAIALASDHLAFRGEPAVARGWLQRARELLEGSAPAPEQAWLLLSEGDLALSIDVDPEVAAARAAAALAVARELDSEDLSTLARALGGAARVARGEPREGLRELDAAATVALSGDVEDPMAIGYSCCYLLHACEQARDFDRGAQWCARVRAFSERARFDVLLAVCRAHHGGVLLGRGQWQEAEAELEASARALGGSRPGLHAAVLLRLSGLRRQQGRLDEASELLLGLGAEPEALVERARLALERDDALGAASLAERVSRRLPEHARLARAGVLELLLEAQVVLGDREGATRTLQELGRALGAADGVPAAAVRLCQGLLARLEANPTAARRALEDAVDGFERCRVPFEAARARLELARELHDAGLVGLARGELAAAARTFEALGAGAALRRATRCASEWASGADLGAQAKGASAPHAGTSAASMPALSAREREVLQLVARGLSNRRIAAELCLSELTVKRHVQNILGKLDVPTRAAAASYAARAGLT